MTRRDDLGVRRAIPGDARAAVRIYVESWNVGFGALMPSVEADAARTDRWSVTFALPPPSRWWVAERDRTMVGFAGNGPSRDPVDCELGELDTIAVDPAAWRTGVGRALMSVAIRWLRSDGYRLALLWTLDRYSRGSSFYEALGWRRNGASRQAGRQVRYDYDLQVGR
jgi:GNAT superfamily N-acetyltransferase